MGAHGGTEESLAVGKDWSSAFPPLPTEAAGMEWGCQIEAGALTFEDSLEGQLNIGGIQGRGLQE